MRLLVCDGILFDKDKFVAAYPISFDTVAIHFTNGAMQHKCKGTPLQFIGDLEAALSGHGTDMTNNTKQ